MDEKQLGRKVKFVEDPTVPPGYLIPHAADIAVDIDGNVIGTVSDDLGHAEYTVECIQEATQAFMEAAHQLEDIGFYDAEHPNRKTRRRMMFGKEGEANECYFADVRDNDLVEVVDGLLDMIVVAWGSLYKFVGPVIAAECAVEVNRSNLDKVNGKHGPIIWDGEPGKSKVKKPEGWRGPDIEGILRRHGLLGPSDEVQV